MKRTTANTTTMDAKQIIDVLPSYISLFSHHSNPNPIPNPIPNSDRSSILKWFSSLSPHHRLAHLTIVDPTFTRLLLRMLSSPLHTTFLLLSDLPSSHGLPTLCTRLSRGLLARVADSRESTRRLRSFVRLFSSSESSALDTVAFTEEFVSDVAEFVEVMDELSDSGFLSNQEWGEMVNEWPEMGWLKAKGYYCVEEFVANRVEVALRLGWLNSGSNNTKRLRSSVKLKEKAKSVVGLGFNVYWRQKGCVDWWERLDDVIKRKVFLMVLRKTAKALVCYYACLLD